MPKPRSPVLGFNHNVRHKGWLFHIQTEDSGIQNPHIFTHLFHDGVIFTSKKVEYDAESDADIVKGLMQAQHKAVMRELKHGRYDDKIQQYLGTAPAGAEAAKAPSPLPNPPPRAGFEDAGSLPYEQFELQEEMTPLPELPQESPEDLAMTIERVDPGRPFDGPLQSDEDDVDVSGVFRMISTSQSEMPAEVADPGGVIDSIYDDRPTERERSGPQVLGVMPETTPPPMPGYDPRARRTTSPPMQAVKPTPTGQRAPSKPRAEVVPPRAEAGTLPLPPPRPPGPPGAGVVRSAPPIAVGGAKPTPPPPPPARPKPPPPPPQSGVVVTRPAVVVGAPNRMIGADATPPPPAAPTDPQRPRRPQSGGGRELTPPPGDNIFGQDLISEKSLDEVIMAYLSEDAEEEGS